MTFSYVFTFTKQAIKEPRFYTHNNNNEAEHFRAGKTPAFLASYQQATPLKVDDWSSEKEKVQEGGLEEKREAMVPLGTTK